MATYVGQNLLVKKSAAIVLLLLGIVLIVIGLGEDSSAVITLGALSLLGGAFLLVLKIIRRNQAGQLWGPRIRDRRYPARGRGEAKFRREDRSSQVGAMSRQRG